MELQRLIDYCGEQINEGKLDGMECPDLDECQIEIQVFERLAVEEVIRSVRNGKSSYEK
ncbi:MAG: hypothetical protein OEY01_11060 [Desulfobulbaceae bacterium]|nr:hypothetical protein [Desulfobulbaceae bacterium]